MTPYAIKHASENTCNSGFMAFGSTVVRHRGKTVDLVAMSISSAMLGHWVLSCCGNGSSHSILCCHISCINNLARMVTGDSSPCGS